jgi:hypothetical protein
MSREAARIGITNALLALKATYPGGLEVELPNQVELDPAAQTAPFMKVRIVYQDGYQASLSRHHRVIGHLVLECWVNAGLGTKPANDMMEHFYKPLHMSDSIPGVRTYAAKFIANLPRPGWDIHPVIIPFWFDDY